jgi:pimeloyl-ACP methyl ester carboxylesterase
MGDRRPDRYPIGISATPARQGTVRLPDDRELRYAEFGDHAGRPVVLLHGNPGSRLACPDVPATTAASVRLITFDRPGFGGSDPRPLHHLDEVAEELEALAVALELGSFPVIGWSGGGPYALACAARLPGRITAVALVSSSGLPDDPDVLAQRTPEAEAMVDRLRSGSPDAAAQARHDVAQRVAAYGERPTMLLGMALSNEVDPDRAWMQQPAVAAALTTMWEEGARQGTAGLVDGWIALWALPWRFTLAALPVPVTQWHGTGDLVVPIAQADRMADAIPGVVRHRCAGEGHLVALVHWAEILDELLAHPG